MKSLCSLNMNSTKLSADTYEDLKVSFRSSLPVFLLSFLCKCKSPEAERLATSDFVTNATRK